MGIRRDSRSFRSVVWLLLPFVALLLLSACDDDDDDAGDGVTATTASADGGTTDEPLSRDTLRVSYTRGVHINGLQWVAADQDVFGEYGLTVDLRAIDSSGSDIIAALLGGEVDVACGVGAADGLRVIDEGGAIKAIFGQATNPDWELIIRRTVAEEAGIPVDGTPEEQAAAVQGSGLTIAFSREEGSPYTRFAASAKLGYDMEPGVDYQPLFAGSFSNIFAAYSSGDADGFGSLTPTVFLVPDDEIVRIRYDAFDDTIADTNIGYCYVQDQLIEENPDTLTAFAAGMQDASDMILGDEEAARESLREFWAEAQIDDPTVQDRAFERIQEIYERFPDGEVTREIYESTLAFENYIFENFLDTPPSDVAFEDFVDNSFVEAAREG